MSCGTLSYEVSYALSLASSVLLWVFFLLKISFHTTLPILLLGLICSRLTAVTVTIIVVTTCHKILHTLNICRLLFQIFGRRFFLLARIRGIMTRRRRDGRLLARVSTNHLEYFLLLKHFRSSRFS